MGRIRRNKGRKGWKGRLEGKFTAIMVIRT